MSKPKLIYFNLKGAPVERAAIAFGGPPEACQRLRPLLRQRRTIVHQWRH